MKRFITLCAVLLCCLSHGYGQDTLKTSKLGFPTFRIGYSPSALTSLLPAIQFSGDYGFYEGRFNIGLEAGYIYTGMDNILTDNHSNSRGINSRVSFEIAAARKEESCLFVGVALNRKKYEMTEKEWLTNRTSRYSEYADNTRSFEHLGIAYLIGFLNRLTDRLFLEAHIGMGSNKLTVKRYIKEDEIEADRRKRSGRLLYYNLNISYDLSFRKANKRGSLKRIH